MTLGDSTNLQVGQKVYAIGNPFGLAGTLTRGIVSSIRQVQEPDGMDIDEAIQTDAAINPGNSGGPLLNWHGEVIGINTMIASSVGQSAGIGFAIPINTAKAVLNDLVTLGRVRRPALGVRTIPIDPELAEQMGLAADYGLLIVQAVPGGAADRAGLHGGTERAYLGNMPIMIGGDLIVAIDGEKIEEPAGPGPGHEQTPRRRHHQSHYLPRQEETGRQRRSGRGSRPGVKRRCKATGVKATGVKGEV